MSRDSQFAPRYCYIGTDDRLVKHYRIKCHFCGTTWEVGLPKHTSTGFYFSYPLRCDHCHKHATYYRAAEPFPSSIREEEVRETPPR